MNGTLHPFCRSALDCLFEVEFSAIFSVSLCKSSAIASPAGQRFGGLQETVDNLIATAGHMKIEVRLRPERHGTD